MKIFRSFWVVVFCTTLLSFSLPLQAQTTEDETSSASAQDLKVTRIDVQGNRIVSTQTILNKMKAQPGVELTQRLVNEDIKRLYGTGFFQDIRIDMEEQTGGVRLIVLVEEKPVVRYIEIEGNKLFKERELRKELEVMEGQILDEFKIQQGINKIKEKYAGKGFRFVDINYTIETDRTGKEAAITVHIQEGEKFLVDEIRFEGVNAFKERNLRKLMKTKERKIWLLRFGVFREMQFEEDLDRIQAYYQDHGYLDVQVDHDVQYMEPEQNIIITIKVDEGRQYRTGRVEISGMKVLPESEVWQRLDMLPGSVYAPQRLSEEVKMIRDFYSEHGYLDVRVIPKTDLNTEAAQVSVRYQIEEGDLYFVDKVQIRGNTKTKDIVIRRELRIHPGEKFNGEAIERSKQRLDNLGYFEEVTYDTEEGSAGNRKNIIFRVKEKRTGELSFGAGISSIDRFIAFGEITQRNFDLLNWPRFTGGGQQVSARVHWGSITKEFQFSFLEPYLFNKPISAGLDAYRTQNEDENVDFEERRLGAGITFSKAFTDFLRLGLGYKFENVDLTDIESDASPDVLKFAGDRWLSRLKLFLTYDKRDNVFNPTTGWLAGVSGELIGTFLGGGEDYYITQANLTKYWSFFEPKHVVEWRTRLGFSDELGSGLVPVFDRFFAGGFGTIRGFEYRRVGPIEGGDAIGGSSMVIMNFEYTAPVPYVEDIVKAAVFFDVGQISRDSWDFGFSDIQASVGPGLKVKTPLGPLAFYYGYPVMNADEKTKNGRFEFSLSRSF